MSEEQTITVFYSCPLCSLTRMSCEIPARKDEDIKTWMDNVILFLSDDHNKRSPNCHPEMLHNIMIPIDGASKIGGPAVN